jgi:peptidoglycan/LPS O-acetylase OafA/YrhL
MALLLLATVRHLQGGTNSFASLPASLMGLDFFIHGDLMLWFPPAMIGTYLLFLVIWPLFRRTSHSYALAAGLCVSAWAVGAALSMTETAPHLLIWSTRLPTFFLGLAIGKDLARGNHSLQIGPIWLVASAIGGGALWIGLRHALPDPVAWRWGIIWAPFFFLALPLSIAVGTLGERIPSRLDKLTVPLRWMGENSLELYLLHLVAVETLWGRFDACFHSHWGAADLMCLTLAFVLTPSFIFLRGLLSPGRSKRDRIGSGNVNFSSDPNGKT